jgi:hypothetical protein
LRASLSDVLGAVGALVIYSSSILTFTARLLGRPGLGRVFGYPLLVTGPLLIYLLIDAPRLHRGALYYVQAGLMLSWIVVVLVLDYILKVDFRRKRWAVIAFVVHYFAGTGGMLGLASTMGPGWTVAAVVLFLVAGVLAFVQRRVTAL